MTTRRAIAWSVAGVVLLAVFAAYDQPALVVDFANLLRSCF